MAAHIILSDLLPAGRRIHDILDDEAADCPWHQQLIRCYRHRPLHVVVTIHLARRCQPAYHVVVLDKHPALGGLLVCELCLVIEPIEIHLRLEVEGVDRIPVITDMLFSPSSFCISNQRGY